MSIYFPTELATESQSTCTIIEELIKITPYEDIPLSKRYHLKNYYRSIESSIRDMLPEPCVKIAQNIYSYRDKKQISNFYRSILENSPVIKARFSNEGKNAFLIISTFCPSIHTGELGRFLSDYFTKWLLPGKILTLDHVHSSIVKFILSPLREFFFHEIFVKIDSTKKLAEIKENIATIIKDIKINILTVSRTRRILSIDNLSHEQKKIIIQENISEFLDIQSLGSNQNLFDQMQLFIQKASSENNTQSIRNHISPLLDKKPQYFKRDLFNELHLFIFPMSKNLKDPRSILYLSRVVSYSYLLQKNITYNSSPEQKGSLVSTKILRTHIKGQEYKKLIGVITAIGQGVNHEISDENQILVCIHSIIPSAKLIPNSVINSKKNSSEARIIYLEIIKNSGDFSKQEIAQLQNNLTREILSKLGTFNNTIFMPRNEEEVLRNVLTLSNQIKFPSDLPQIMINYRSQEKNHLQFTVIIVRVEHPWLNKITVEPRQSNKKIFIRELEKKTVGMVRKKIKKHAYIIEISSLKKKYLRKDFSLDLISARKEVLDFILSLTGDARDFNGGMIAKQTEVLTDLKRQLFQNNFSDDFCIENFFYSFIPRFMQSILPATSLKHSFLFLQEALQHDFNKCIYFTKTITWEKYFIITVATINQSFRQFIDHKISNIDFDPSSLAVSYTYNQEIPVLSYVLHFSDPIQSEKLLKTLVEGIKLWKESLY